MPRKSGGWIRLFRLNGLRAQLFATFMLTNILILSIASLYFYTNLVDTVKERSEESTLQAFHQSETNIRVLREEVNRISKSILVEEWMQQLLEADDDSFTENLRLQEIKDGFDSILRTYNNVHSIYLMMGSGFAIGDTRGKFLLNRVNSGRNEFLESVEYETAMKSFPYITWGSGWSSARFENIFQQGDVKDNSELVGAFRGVKGYYQSDISAVLAITVDTRTLDRLFVNLADGPNVRIYLVDKNGRRITGGEPRQEVIRRLKDREFESSGSQTVKIKGERLQVITYQLAGTDWSLVKEVPYKQFARDVNRLRSVILVMLSISILLALMLSSLWIHRLTRPLIRLSRAMKQVEEGQIGLVVAGLGNNELDRVGHAFNKMSLSLAETIDANKRIEEEKRSAEIKVLYNQINPHFLHNTLNSVKWMALMIGARNIADVLTSLGNLLKPIFRNAEPTIRLEDELEYTQHYVDIMNYRYGEGIGLLKKVPAPLLDALVPRFILQPLVENSITHGMKQRYRLDITIEVHVTDNDQSLIIRVMDNGKGIDPGRLADIRSELRSSDDEEAGIGLVNVDTRIKHYFGYRYGVAIDNGDEAGTLVTITLPYQPKIRIND